MFNTKEKKERALGTKLFLKSSRCLSPKCVTVRRPTRPGAHGRDRQRPLSEFGQQLKEKQKFQWSYGLREAQMKKVFRQALKNPAVTGNMIVSLLERRLDNVVYRLGLALSRSVARQLVGHGHITVNSRKVTVPSYLVRAGDVIAIREQSKNNPVFKDLNISLKKYEPPIWLYIDKEKYEGKVVSPPKDFEVPFDVSMVVDYYSKVVK
ncbi:MAG TPA: 30S ribosomal protein S4 [Candidatus Paceibacterota bacterium]